MMVRQGGSLEGPGITEEGLECLSEEKGIVVLLSAGSFFFFSFAKIWVLRENFQSSDNLTAIIIILEGHCILKISSLSFASSPL